MSDAMNGNETKLFVFIYIDDKKQPKYLFDYENKFSDLNNVDINYFNKTYGIKWRTTEVREQLEKTFIMGEIIKKDNIYSVKLTDTIYTSNDGILKCESSSEISDTINDDIFIQKLGPLFRYAKNYSIVKDYQCSRDKTKNKYPKLPRAFYEFCGIMSKLMFYLLNDSQVDVLQLKSKSPYYKENVPSFIEAFIKLNENKIEKQDIDKIFQNMYNSFLSIQQLSSIVESVIQNTNQPIALKNEVVNEEEKEDRESKEKELHPIPDTAQLENENNTIEEIISGILNNINKEYNNTINLIPTKSSLHLEKQPEIINVQPKHEEALDIKGADVNTNKLNITRSKKGWDNKPTEQTDDIN